LAYEIYSYGNVDALHGVFNAVTMIVGGSDYRDMVRTCMVLGFMAVGICAALPGQSWRGWRWLMTVILIYSTLFVPRVDVLIVDKLGVQPPVAVANVPWALGLFASVKSTIGQTLTQLFETAFQAIPNPRRALPAELRYQEHGLMFGSRLIKASRSANIIDPQLRADIINYNRNCVVPEIGHSIDAKTFQQSGNLWGSAATTNKALFTNYLLGGAYIVRACDVAYADLSGLLPAAITEVRAQIAAALFPDLAPAAALANIDASLEAAYRKTALAAAASAASDILLQNMMINAFADTQQVISVATADPASVMLAATRANATAQMNMSYTTQGRIAEEALPIVRNVTEGILFAVFPVVVLLLVASEGQALGRILKSYLYALLWVELWPVMFAVLNFIATTYSARNIAAMAFTGAGTALSLDNAGPIYTTALADVSVVGYMVTMVPALAAALLFGMDRIVSAVPAQGIGSAADREAAQTSKGNLGYGNLQFESQGLAPNQTDAFMRSRVGVAGKMDRNILSGDGVDTYNLGSNPVGIRDTQQISTTAGIERGKALERADTLGKQASTEMAAAFGNTVALLKSAGRTSSRGLGLDMASMGSDGTTATDLRETARDVAKSLGVSDKDLVAKALMGRVGFDAVIGGASVEGRAVSQEEVSTALRSGQSALAKKGVARQSQLVESFRTADEFRDLRSSNREASDRIDANFSNATRFQESSAAALKDAERYNEVLRRAELVSRDTTYDYTRDWNKWLRNKGLSLTTDHGILLREAQAFLLSGEVYAVDGVDRFMPQNGGGPNIMQRVQDSVAGISPTAMQAGYDEAKPASGQDTVAEVGAQQRSQVLAAQRMQGLNPEAAVTDGGLGAKVRAKADEASADIDSAKTTAGEKAYAVKQEFNDRVAKVEPNPIGKPATKAARFGSGGSAEVADKFPGAVKPSDPPGFPPGYVPGSGTNEIPRN
jgi:conjugal transfer mating pair stabilization protein TraG